MSSATPDSTDPEQLKKFFEKWWEIAASISGTIVSAFRLLLRAIFGRTTITQGSFPAGKALKKRPGVL
jgi:hypothetical protein